MPLFVKPLYGATVPMPDYRGLPEVLLPQKGSYVPEEGYWFRRLREKVVEHIPPRPTKENKNGFYVHKNGHWWFRREHEGKTPSMESPNETGDYLEEGYWFRKLMPIDVRVAMSAPSPYQKHRGVAMLYREGYFFELWEPGKPLSLASKNEEVTYLHENEFWYRRLPRKEEEEEEEEEKKEEEEGEEEEEEKKGDETQAPSSTASQTAHTDTSLENNT